MIRFICEYRGCCLSCDYENCEHDQIEECYYNSICGCDNTFAEAIDYGGYGSVDEFWDNLLG